MAVHQQGWSRGLDLGEQDSGGFESFVVLRSDLGIYLFRIIVYVRFVPALAHDPDLDTRLWPDYQERQRRFSSQLAMWLPIASP